MPTVLFIMLFATFCKVNPRDMRVRGWHVWLVTFRLLSCLLIALYLHFTPGAPGELLLEGLMLCLVCPTAGAAAVITGRFGGRHGRRNSRLPCDAPPHGGFCMQRAYRRRYAYSAACVTVSASERARRQRVGLTMRRGFGRNTGGEQAPVTRLTRKHYKKINKHKNHTHHYG